MGEKDHIYKNSLWEESTRVPLIIRVPEMTVPNTVVEHPVSLIDVYPTLLELAGIDLETRKNKKHPRKSLENLRRPPRAT